MIFLDSDCLLQVCLSYIYANVATFLIQPILLYILQINKENIPPIDIQPIFKCDFCSFLAKTNLNRKIYVFCLFSTEWMFPRLALTLCQAKIVLCFFHEWGLHPSDVTDNGGNVGGKNGGVPSLSVSVSAMQPFF